MLITRQSVWWYGKKETWNRFTDAIIYCNCPQFLSNSVKHLLNLPITTALYSIQSKWIYFRKCSIQNKQAIKCNCTNCLPYERRRKPYAITVNLYPPAGCFSQRLKPRPTAEPRNKSKESQIGHWDYRVLSRANSKARDMAYQRAHKRCGLLNHTQRYYRLQSRDKSVPGHKKKKKKRTPRQIKSEFKFVIGGL